MDFKELKLMKENENYLEVVKQGKPVAVFKTRKNADETYSVYVEMFNCSKTQVAFIQKAADMRLAGDFPV